jgi:glycosyltransferase involved in cell wall biosynthesis
VYQRPQHLMSRAAQSFQTFYFEEPVIAPEAQPHLQTTVDPSGVVVVTPIVPKLGSETALIDSFIAANAPKRRALWYYTPMARAATAHLTADLIVYDCMDELSAFHAAPPEMRLREAELLRAADVVFTGGQSLYEAKRGAHPNVHAFPSSVDAAHFAQSRRRAALSEHPDQAHLPRPRLGFFGVIDERLDIGLLDRMAALRPDWSFIMIGPVVKIDPAILPKRPNIHWLGGRKYEQLPDYLAHWDLGIMPFALNEATRYISPTKTPEFLAAGLPVVSTAITDVVRPYGERGLVEIGADPEDFVARAERLLARPRESWLREADALLAGMSWDRTWGAMLANMNRVDRGRRRAVPQLRPAAAEASHAGI